jgi:hypothetical protein
MDWLDLDLCWTTSLGHRGLPRTFPRGVFLTCSLEAPLWLLFVAIRWVGDLGSMEMRAGVGAGSPGARVLGREQVWSKAAGHFVLPVSRGELWY